MFGLSLTHLIVVFVLALILIGPEELPEVARMIGRFLNELKRSADSIKDDFKYKSRKKIAFEEHHEKIDIPNSNTIPESIESNTQESKKDLSESKPES